MSLGDDEHPIGFLFEPEVRGEHVHVTVRAGQPGMRALAGTLVLRQVEWAALLALLGRVREINDQGEVMWSVRSTEKTIVVHLVDQPIEIAQEVTP